MNGELRIYPASGYVIVVLANLDPPAASRAADFIGNRLP
jgi:D-alanyl-D-alanine carboxypeptidase